MYKYIFLSLMLMVLFGCATSYKVNMTGYGGQENYKDQTYSFDLSSDIKTDLEAMKYIETLETQLACIGWQRNENKHSFVISPSFGITGAKNKPEVTGNFSFGLGMFNGGMGSGASIGTFLGTSTEPSSTKEFTKFLDIKLFDKGKTDQAPLWQGKVFSQDESKTLADVMPVLIKLAVENFGKNTGGSKDFTFKATDINLKALQNCTVEKP
ncbi:MAG: hypothetical protein AB7E96_10735 [Deferribacterales bacterium]